MLRFIFAEDNKLIYIYIHVYNILPSVSSITYMTVNLILLKYIYNASETFLSIILTCHQNFSNKYYKRLK